MEKLKLYLMFFKKFASIVSYNLRTNAASSVARGAGSIAPLWHAEYAKYLVFSYFETDFCPKSENSSSSIGIGMQNMSNLTLDLEVRLETKIDLSLGETFFFGLTCFRSQKPSEFWVKTFVSIVWSSSPKQTPANC